MTGKQFVVQIERTFGDYRPGMRDAVMHYVTKRRQEFLEELYVEIVRLHEGNWPPTLATIMKLEREIYDRPPQFKMLEEPPVTDEERQEVAAGLRALIDDLAKKKRARPDKSKGGKS